MSRIASVDYWTIAESRIRMHCYCSQLHIAQPLEITVTHPGFWMVRHIFRGFPAQSKLEQLLAQIVPTPFTASGSCQQLGEPQSA